MQSIKEIKEYLEQLAPMEAAEAAKAYQEDSRKGVQQVVLAVEKRIAALAAEDARLEQLLRYERECYALGYSLVAGIDEVGRGPLAGPVVAAAVILPENCKIPGVDDSKRLSAKKREMLYDIILEQAISYGIGIVSPERIDEINILQATYEAMRQALSALNPVPRFILADAVTIPEIHIPQKGIIQGDAKSLSIGAASIVAKVYRDRLMEAYEEVYPAYGFASNKGYGSAEHIAAIRLGGLCPIHRRSFVKNLMDGNNRAKGIYGEELAAKQMEKMGYTILERNVHMDHAEIDIIAQKDTYIVFTEVKYRKGRTKGQPGEAVDVRKQRQIIKGAQAYIVQRKLQDRDFRFDVAEILEEDGKTYFKYTENAFWLT